MRPDTSVRTTRPKAASRCLKEKRRNAMDEIEAWISDERSEFGRGSSSRVSAQPSKNVTEQKMLEAKLFEMSKQRYNYMLHTKWQQKSFMEKQRQKTTLMKDLLKNVDLSKIRRGATTSGRRESQFGIPSVRVARSPAKVATSEQRKHVDDLQTLSPAAAMIDHENHQKKVVTFITESGSPPPNRDTPPASPGPIIAVQSANEHADATLHPDATNNPLPDLNETNALRAYIIPLKGRWPVQDGRFKRLREALSENYHHHQRKNVPMRSLALV